ncbi:MAG: hypothetical protein ACE3JK_05615 [Sporolactobacillus sp.]
MEANQLTLTEKRIIQRYIFLPMIRLALERDRKILAASRAKFRTYYIQIIDEALHRVSHDIRLTKDELFDSHIHITRQSWLDYQVYTRGRLFKIVYSKSAAGDWIYERMDRYLCAAGHG